MFYLLYPKIYSEIFFFNSAPIINRKHTIQVINMYKFSFTLDDITKTQSTKSLNMFSSGVPPKIDIPGKLAKFSINLFMRREV